jgi:hypothetical protein
MVYVVIISAGRLVSEYFGGSNSDVRLKTLMKTLDPDHVFLNTAPKLVYWPSEDTKLLNCVNC